MIQVEKLTFAVDTLTNFTENVNRNNAFVSWGLDNMFPEELYRLLDMSPIHNACVRSKVDNCFGAGYVNDYKVNSKQTLNDIGRQLYFELIVTGNLFLEIVWRQDRSQGIAGFHIIPSKYMRVHKPIELGAPATKYLYCRDWINWRKAGMIEFSEFDPMNFTDRQIVHIRMFQPGYEYYGAPDYLSTINDIRLNHQITVYNLANLINGANPSLWVHFNTPAPDSENEQTQILRNIENRYQGSENAGRVIVSYGDSNEKPDITQIASNLQQGFYSEVFELVQKQILSGHKIVDGSLIGLPNPGGFSSSADQLQVAYQLFLKTSINPLQTFMNRELKDVFELIYPGQEIDLTITQQSII
jgi:phage portal protein BeeE